MQDVRIIVTGGTIDKVHDPFTEGLAFSKEAATHVPDILARGRCHFAEVEPLLQMDSLDFTDVERDAIADAINAAPERAIVVTHGTGTMGESARWVKARVNGKTVVFTGAMRPFTLGGSDASFNLGGAVIAAQTLPEGVYGVMNGRVFEADELRKNTELGRFDV